MRQKRKGRDALDQWGGGISHLKHIIATQTIQNTITFNTLCSIVFIRKVRTKQQSAIWWDVGIESRIKNGVDLGWDDSIDIGIKDDMELGWDDGIKVGIKVGIKDGLEIGLDDGIKLEINVKWR